MLSLRRILSEIKGFEDLARKGMRFINRQTGLRDKSASGSPFEKVANSSSKIEGYEQEVYTHLEVGLSILSKEADVGIATMAVSKLLGLDFIPITQGKV